MWRSSNAGFASTAQGFHENQQVFHLWLAFLIAATSGGFFAMDKPDRQIIDLRVRLAAKQPLVVERNSNLGRKMAT
jgi:hypothetical protein